MFVGFFYHDACGLTLAEKGQTSYSIVLGENASEVEKTAAKELQYYLQAVTGAKFPISPSSDLSGTKIFVGSSNAVREMMPEVRWDRLGADGIVMKTVDDDLILAGGSPRGTLYAVYTFLEENVGVRWWTSTEQFIPRKPTLTVETLNVTYSPKLFYRGLLFQLVKLDPFFPAKLKLNGDFEYIPDSHGGHYKILGFCHTFYQLLPPETYFAQHPDWYSLIQGKRSSSAQLCLTNPEMRKELTRVALEWIRKNPNTKIISISQNDGRGGACECETCKALRDREGSESGPMLHFVNAVAKEIGKEFPDVWVETLAYTYTRVPPIHVKPAPNVIIRLCPIESFVDRPFTDSINASFQKDITSWSRIAPRLFIWDYVTNFINYVGFHPNLYNFGTNVRYFVKNNAVGVFEQGNGESPVGDFEELRIWVLAHLLWDPSQDEKKLIQEFMEGYYGPAAPYLLSYLELIQQSSKDKKVPVTCNNTDYGFMGLAEMNQATRLFDQAEKAVRGDATLLDRIHCGRLSLDHVWLLRYWWLRQQAEITKAPFLGPEDSKAACEKFIQSCRKFKVRYFEGGEGASASREDLLRNITSRRSEAAVPLECKAKDRKDWCELQESMFPILFTAPVKLIDDPLASDGRALLLSGGVVDWFVRVPLSDVALMYPDPVRCYISVRCEAAGETGSAYTVGCYDGVSKVIFRKDVTLEEAGVGKYRTFDLGVHTFKPGMFLFILSSSSVKSIAIDRVFVVKNK
jgi:hypothetical protein